MSTSKFFKIISVGVLALTLTVLTGGLANAVVTLNATSVTSDVALTLTGTTTSTWSLSGAGAALTINSGGAAALTLDSGTTGAVNLATGASAKTITIGNAASTEVEVNGLLVDINAGATGLTIDAAGASNLTTSSGALTITSAAAATWSTAADVLTVTGAGGLTLDSGTTTAVNLGTAAAAKTITIGNAASTEVEVNGLLVDINAGATGMTVDFGAGNLAITGTGASADFTLDADLISIDATGTSNITVTGAAGEDFTIAQAGAADASLFLSSTGTGADALKISTTGTSGDLWLDSEAGTVIIDAGEAVADALVLRATGGTTATVHLTSNGTGASAIDIDATGTGGDIDIDADDAIDILAGGVFSIDGTGASNVSATSGNLTLSTITSGVLILSSVGNTTLDVATGGLLSIDVAAPGLEVATANNISVAASNSTGVVAQTFVIELTGAEDDEDDFTIRAVGAEGDLLLTSGDDLTIDAVGLLELNSSAGVISIGNDAVNQNINIGTAGTRTIAIGSATGTVNITAADASFIDLSAVLHNDTASQGLKLPNVGAAPTDPTDAGEGYIAWDETNNLLLVNTGAGWASAFNNTAIANTWTDNQIYTFAGDEDIAITSADATGTIVLIDNAGGVQADNTAALFIDAGGNNASGSNMLRLAPTGTPVEGSIGIEFVGSTKVMQAMNIDGDSVNNSVVLINGGGAIADNKAVLEITADGTMVAGSSIVRIASATAAGGATVYGLEISANADNLEGLWVNDGAVVFDETLLVSGLLTAAVGVSSSAQAVTPDAVGGAVITPGVNSVAVAGNANDANDWILLPALSSVPVGHTITVVSNAAGHEVRTPAASNEKINNGDADGDTTEYTIAAGSQIHRFTKIDNTIGWMGQGFTAVGAVVTAITPD